MSSTTIDPGPDYRTGQGYRRDERMERLLQLRNTDPATFRAHGPQTLLAVGTYEALRDAAERNGIKPPEPPPHTPGPLTDVFARDVEHALVGQEGQR